MSIDLWELSPEVFCLMFLFLCRDDAWFLAITFTFLAYYDLYDNPNIFVFLMEIL